jgi:hypothetical protein
MKLAMVLTKAVLMPLITVFTTGMSMFTIELTSRWPIT